MFGRSSMIRLADTVLFVINLVSIYKEDGGINIEIYDNNKLANSLFCSIFVSSQTQLSQTHRPRQETAVALVHADGQSLTLRANQAEPEAAEGAAGGAR